MLTIGLKKMIIFKLGRAFISGRNGCEGREEETSRFLLLGV
jgi:hypothetical protein